MMVQRAFGVVAVAAGLALLGQQPESPSFVTNVNVITAPTIILDKDGEYVTGLKPTEFTLYDNDMKQEIRVDETFAPLSVVVAVQADAKVEGVLPKIQKIGSLLTTLVAGETGEIAIVAFDHRFQVLQDFTNDNTKIQEALKKLKPGSSSSRMTDAIMDSSRMLRGRPKDHRKVVLLISESRDKGSEARIREALSTLEIGNVLVYALNMSRVYTELTAKPAYPRPDPIPPGGRHVPAGAPITPTSIAQMTGQPGYGADFVPMLTEIFRGVKAIFVDNPVEVYTKYTGGKEYPFVTQRDLERAVGAVGRELHNQYLITYSPSTKLEGGYHRIDVRLASRPDLTVRSRPGYWLAAVQSN